MNATIDYAKLLKLTLGIQLEWELYIPYDHEWESLGITGEEKEAIFLLLDQYCAERNVHPHHRDEDLREKS